MPCLRLRRACQSVSGCRWWRRSSDFISGLTGRELPATSAVVSAATDLSWAAVPSVITSDLSAFNCRWFRKNHRLTASEQIVSRLRADVWSLASMWQRRDASRRRNDDETHRVYQLTDRGHIDIGCEEKWPCGTPESIPLVTTNKHTLVSFNSENNLCFAPYLAQSYIDSDEIYREWKCDARSFNDNKLRNCIAFNQSMQWRNKGERGQLPPGAADEGAQNSLTKIF